MKRLLAENTLNWSLYAAFVKLSDKKSSDVQHAADRGAGYCSFIADLTLCRENKDIQMNVPETLLNDSELEATLMNHNSAFHKTCYDQFDVPMIQKRR